MVILLVGATLKYVIFVIIIILIAIVIGLVITNIDFLLANFYWIALLIAFIYVVWRYDLILQLLDYQRAVIFRFGKVNRVGGPGWAFVWPIIESHALVDLRTTTIDVDKQDVVTKDGIELNVDAVVYLKVRKDNQSVVNSIIEVEDYKKASKLFVISSIRDVMGAMVLSEIISHIEVINVQIKESLQRISKEWGVDVNSVEIKDVQIPPTVLEAMHEEKAAVQKKLARMQIAMAHKAEIEAVKEAAKDLDEKALSYYYIKAIEEMSKSKGSKVFFPAEFSKLANAFSSSQLLKASDSGEAKKYKELLEEYVDTAVKKTKKSPNKKSSKKSKTKNSNKNQKSKKKSSKKKSK